jgi:hypothetical protein
MYEQKCLLFSWTLHMARKYNLFTLLWFFDRLDHFVHTSPCFTVYNVVDKKPFCAKDLLSESFWTRSHVAFGPRSRLDDTPRGFLSKTAFGQPRYFWSKVILDKMPFVQEHAWTTNHAGFNTTIYSCARLTSF